MTATDKGSPGVRDRILSAAMQLFYVDGINATGVDLIAARANVSKRTLYKHFPSKVDLVENYLRTLVELRVDPRTLKSASPREKVLALFAVPQPDGGRMRGCPFHNAAVEAASAMPGVSAFVQEQKQAFAAAVVDLCRELGATDPDAVGRQIALVYEGAAALSTSLDAVDPWACARTTVDILLDQATATTR